MSPSSVAATVPANLPNGEFGSIRLDRVSALPPKLNCRYARSSFCPCKWPNPLALNEACEVGLLRYRFMADSSVSKAPAPVLWPIEKDSDPNLL